MTSIPDEVRSTLESALRALKEGDKVTAWRLAKRATELAPESETAWLVLASVSSPEASLEYIHNALQIHPDSQPAKQALRWALARLPNLGIPTLDEEPPAQTSETLPPVQTAVQAEAQTPAVNGAVVSTLAQHAAELASSEEPQPSSETLEGPPEPLQSRPGSEEPHAQEETTEESALLNLPEGHPASIEDTQPVKVQRTRLFWDALPLSPIFRFGLPILAVVVMVAVVAAVVFIRPRLTSSQAGATTQTPGPPCGQMELGVGGARRQVETLRVDADGSLKLPTNSGNTAFLVDGKAGSYLIALSPDSTNLAMVAALKTGDLATVYFPSCEVVTFSLTAPEAGQGYSPALLEQPGASFVLFVQSGSNGVLVRGEPVQPQVAVTDTPQPAGMQSVEAEISLLDAKSDLLKTQLTVSVEVHNTGSAAFTVKASDVALSVEGKSALALKGSQPQLPREVIAGATEKFRFIFERPSTSSATLQILGVELDLEGY